MQVEASTEDFLARWFEDTKGDLYEGPTDISNWKNLDLDSDPNRAQRGLLMGFTEAAKRAEDTNDLTHLEDWVDLGHFARFMADGDSLRPLGWLPFPEQLPSLPQPD